MKIIDISMEISKTMMVYKNKTEKKPSIENESNFETDSHYESKITMNLHTGSHVDAPKHFLNQGNTMEGYPLERFIGKALVVDLSTINVRVIERRLLEDLHIQENMIVLFKTQNSSVEVFESDFVYLSHQCASYLVEKGIKLVGIDGLGIERGDPLHQTHKILLGAGIPIVEGLRLKEVKPGSYTFIGFPIKIANVEAAPIRGVLLESE